MSKHNTLDYVELAAADLEATQLFFEHAFGWSFNHYGPDYMDCLDNPIGVGFYRAGLKSVADQGGALVTLFSDNLEATLHQVTQHGGQISKEIFSFPGGRRFQFFEPSGNEFGVWSNA